MIHPPVWTSQLGLMVWASTAPHFVAVHTWNPAERPTIGGAHTVIDDYHDEAAGYYRVSYISPFRHPVGIAEGQGAAFYFAGDGKIPSLVIEAWQPADANFDGVVNSADISHFLTLWIGGVPECPVCGDFNADLSLTTADISAFLEAWLEGVQ